MNILFDFFFGIPGDLDDAAVEVIHEGVGRKHVCGGGVLDDCWWKRKGASA
jgi:hypothetical protein